MREVREQRIAAGVLLVDAHTGYFNNFSVPDRLQADVLAPARALPPTYLADRSEDRFAYSHKTGGRLAAEAGIHHARGTQLAGVAQALATSPARAALARLQLKPPCCMDWGCLTVAIANMTLLSVCSCSSGSCRKSLTGGNFVLRIPGGLVFSDLLITSCV